MGAVVVVGGGAPFCNASSLRPEGDIREAKSCGVKEDAGDVVEAEE